jgi:hypothetical protein
MTKILYVYVSAAQLTTEGLSGQLAATSIKELPEPDVLRGADYVLVCGSLDYPEHAIQLARAMDLAFEHRSVLVVAYESTFDAAMSQLAARVAPGLKVNPLEWEADVEANHTAFHEYFKIFGRTQVTLTGATDAEVLGSTRRPHESTVQPAALYVPRGAGGVYVVPFRLGGSAKFFLRGLFAAIEAHRHGGTQAPPAFMTDVRLPGENDLLEKIARREDELDGLRIDAARLAGFRSLLGSLSGDALESLVIDALNVILDGTGYRAEDRSDVGGEDFWIVGPDGNDFAFAEVKGTNTHIRRDDVNQADTHREESGLDPSTPGLLIINIFRGRDELDQRKLAVNEQVVRRASSSSILAMRTYDLFNLLHQRLAGEDVGPKLIKALRNGGGWLEVDDLSFKIHDDSGA